MRPENNDTDSPEYINKHLIIIYQINFIMETKVIARINDMDIISSSDEQYVPIRPICTALGIDPKSQMNKIKRDSILSSHWTLITSTGADGKLYKMLAIPYFLVFGWIYSIDEGRVSPESIDRVREAKISCMKALYNYIRG